MAPIPVPADTRQRARAVHTIAPTQPIALLAEDITAAWAFPPGRMRRQITAALARAAADPSLLAPEQRSTRRDCYARHLLYADPAGRFAIVSLVWDVGQFSPVHGHHTWCAYVVHDQELEETLFAWDAGGGRARPGLRAVRPAGYVCFSEAGLDQIHRLGNSGSRPAISIHVYGVDGARVGTGVNRTVDVAS
jgi:predicted metal-dependent enzyme (double-stranded beta helix superfamily)